MGEREWLGRWSWTNGSGHEGSPDAAEVRFYPLSDEELVKMFFNKAEAPSDLCFKDNTRRQGCGSMIPPSSTCTRVTHAYILSPWLPVEISNVIHLWLRNKQPAQCLTCRGHLENVYINANLDFRQTNLSGLMLSSQLYVSVNKLHTCHPLGIIINTERPIQTFGA